MENFVLILALLALGALLRRLGVFPESTGKSLNLFVVYVSLPALILVQIPRLEFSADLWVPVAMPWVMLAASAAMVFAAARVFAWERTTTGGLLLAVTLGNTSFLGIPMVQTFFGEGHVGYALLYDQLGTFLALAILGPVILAVYGGGEKATTRQVLMRIVTFPPFLALVLGLALRGWAYPAVVESSLARIAATLVPVVMVAVGFELRWRLARSDMAPLASGLVIKLALTPLLALGLVTALGLHGEPARIAVFQAGMPPMITAGALAMAAGLAPRAVASLIGFGIPLSFVTLPVVFSLL